MVLSVVYAQASDDLSQAVRIPELQLPSEPTCPFLPDLARPEPLLQHLGWVRVRHTEETWTYTMLARSTHCALP